MQKKQIYPQIAFVIGLLSFFLTHPYQDISGDAVLYLKSAIHGIFPEHFAGDLFFIGTAQDSFSLFSFFYRPLILLLGSYNAALFLATISVGLWIFACLFFIRKWTANVFPVFIFFTVIQYSYGPWNRIGEYLCTSRTIAEAFAILGFAFLFKQKQRISLIFFLLGTFCHPLIAGWGLPIWCFFFYPKTILPVSIAALLFPLCGFFDISLFTTYDSVWADSVTEFYPQLWDLIWFVIYLAIFTLAYRIFFRKEGKFFQSFLVVFTIAVYWTFAGLVFKNVFLVVTQSWRMEWMLIFFTVFAVGYFGEKILKPRRFFRLFQVHPVLISLFIGGILFCIITTTLKTLLSSDFEFNGGVSLQTLVLVWPQSLLILFSILAVFLLSKKKKIIPIIYTLCLGFVSAVLFVQSDFGKPKKAFDEMDAFLKKRKAPFEALIKTDFDKTLYFCKNCFALSYLSATYYGVSAFNSISRDRFLESRRRTAQILNAPEIESKPFEYPYYGFPISDMLNKPETYQRLLESGEIKYVVSDNRNFLGKFPLDSLVLPVSRTTIYLFGK